MPEQGDLKTAFCNKCAQDTTHHIVTSNTHEWSEVIGWDEFADEITMDGSDIREVLQCCGCKETAYFHTSYSSEDTEYGGRPIPTIRRFPPKQERKFPEWVESGVYVKRSHFLRRLLNEIYTSIAHESFAMAAMGVRALIELMMVEQIGDQGTIGKNISKFESEGFVGAKQRRVLADTVDFGSAAIHRDFAPNRSEVTRALDIAETIAKQIYVHTDESTSLGERAPARS